VDSKPFLFLDVDGVLCPFGITQPPNYYLVETAEGEAYVNASHGAALRYLGSMFDIVWATMWEDEANVVIGPALGLDRFPFIEFTEGRADGTWKLPNVQRYAGDRPFVWIDDELFADAYRWSENLSQPNLLVRPNPNVGMTEDHLRDIETFGRSLAAK
jgi:HAD domain in Swiss Army Knife RNA repair proteins